MRGIASLIAGFAIIMNLIFALAPPRNAVLLASIRALKPE
jgi:hypothetical protein